MKNKSTKESDVLEYQDQKEILQDDHGVPFINDSVSKTEPIRSPEERGEESVIGSMTNPEADDDVDDFGDPFGKRNGEE